MTLSEARRERLSIVICTYDRQLRLLETLQAIDDLGYIEKHDVVVVENTDDEAKRGATVALCRARFPKLKVVESAIAGLSRARNIGLNEAECEIVAFLDDDATPESGWAEAILERRSDDEILYGGGPIDPQWEVAPPAWLPEEAIGALSVLNLGGESRPLREGEFVYGANMFFRARALKAIGGFDESLGRVRDNLQSEEDIAVQRRLAAVGQGFYVANAWVRHFIPASRVNWPWLLKRFSWQGFSEIAQTGRLEKRDRATLAEANSNPARRRLIDALIATPRSKQDALQRLNFVRAMFGVLFHGRAEDFLTAFDAEPASRREDSTACFSSPEPGSLRERSLLPPQTNIGERSAIFFEVGRTHSYLMDAYGDIRGAKLLNPWFDPWNDRVAGDEALRQLRSFLHVATRPFLLSLDWILHNENAVAQLAQIGGAGVVHRVFRNNPEVVRNLRRAAKSTVLLAYSETVARWVQEASGAPCQVIRHPPLLFKNIPPESVRQARDLKVSSRGMRPLVVAMMGEVRPGKGFEWVIRELAAQAKSALVGNIVLCLAGGASVEDAAALRRQLDRSRLRFEFAVRPRTPLDHRGIPDASFAKLLEKADIALFPYTGPEADSMSGHFVDSVFAGCRVIVAEESAMAPLVDRWTVGSVVAAPKRGALLAALEKEVAISSFSVGDDANLDAFAATYAIQAVNEEIVAVMRR